jgi:hypothetical protein
MFNQILVHPDDQEFHRFSPTEEPTIYQWLRLSQRRTLLPIQLKFDLAKVS